MPSKSATSNLTREIVKSRAEIAQLKAQLAKKERILEEIRLQGDSPEWQHEICMSCLKLIPHNHANCYDCNKSAQLAELEAQLAEALDCNCSQKHALRSLRAQIAEPEVTDAMVEAVWQALKSLEGLLIAQNIWSVHKDEFCRRIAQAVLDAPATGTNDSAASLGYLAAQALLEKVETHDQP